ASAALAVVEPQGSGLGGGGFWLLHRGQADSSVMVDGRERAPRAASEDMYVDESGERIPRLSLDGPLAAGIPGEPAALDHIARHYGDLPLARSLAPAIRLAREGFTVNADYQGLARFRLEALRAQDRASRLFLDDGEPPEPGWRLRQPALARTLERLAEDGRDGFYRGPVARAMVDSVRAGGGIWTLADLAEYEVIEREPIRFDYRGIRVTSAPPPSAGGVGLATMLNILERFELADMSRVDRVHHVVEAMRRAYRDRHRYLGDPDFVDIPVSRLTSDAYAGELAAGIDPARASASRALTSSAGGRDTTHLSIIDTEGNRVAATLSVNYPFGAAWVAGDTGVLLNDEMDDFAARPGKPNAYGLIGGEPNAIAPGKRPLSSMSPTFLETPDRVAVLGTPGGSRIITMVLLGALAFERGEPPTAWVTRPRYHHQYLPDHIQHEPDTFDADTAGALRAMGHELESVGRHYGDMQAILWDRVSGTVSAAADPRGQGLGASFRVEQRQAGAEGRTANAPE
ncbi:gamma-glutamyltransferase, partial [Ectothiorhodospiraceae bacterium WFHF3C12]|nr:gamma-glutamyltransferase [Ectothiorhodospiraceae bacterium WFHF3C12]